MRQTTISHGIPPSDNPAPSQQSEFVWTVDEYADAIRKRKRKAFLKQQRDSQRMWPSAFKPQANFLDERAAVAFVVDRRRDQIAELEKQLKSSKEKLRQWEKRLAAIDSEAC